jgi:hypothetical protein
VAENGELRVRWSIVIYVVSLVITALLTYTAIVARVSVIEARQQEADRRLMRMEDKLDQLLRTK